VDRQSISSHLLFFFRVRNLSTAPAALHTTPHTTISGPAFCILLPTTYYLHLTFASARLNPNPSIYSVSTLTYYCDLGPSTLHHHQRSPSTPSSALSLIPLTFVTSTASSRTTLGSCLVVPTGLLLGCPEIFGAYRASSHKNSHLGRLVAP
jgi:hypothetical protein